MAKAGDQGSKSAENAVRVCVRVRPLSGKEKSIGYQNCVAFDEPTMQVVLQAPSHSVSKKHHNKPYHAFAFDHFYGPKDSASDIYEDCVASLVENTTKGFNACVLAYGQTGSGKTHTMSGGTGILGMDDQGIIPEAIEQLFKLLDKAKEAREGEGEEVTVKVAAAALEIYNEELKDLGASSSSGQSSESSERPTSSRPSTARRGGKLEIRDSRNKQSGFSTEVVGLSETEFTCAKDMLRFFTRASRHRSTASTMMNDLSSRSHAIFSVTVEQTAVKYMDKSGNPVPLKMAKGAWWARNGGRKSTNTMMSRLNLVDLAGSERVKKSGVEGKELKEASSINSGLLVLGNVICALADRSEGKSTHIPYRDVKLTRLLQDSLGGNSLTTLISCVSPSDSDFDETFNTLQYANRACKIKNVPLSNSWNQVVEEMSTLPENHSSMMSLLQSQLDSPVTLKRGLRRRDINSVTEDLVEVPVDNGSEKGFTEDFQGRKAAAMAKRSRAAQYDMLRRKALGGMGSKVKDFKKNSTITGKEINMREREQLEMATPTPRGKLLRKSMSASASATRSSAPQLESKTTGKPKAAISVSNTGAGKQMSFAAWMASMREEESDDSVAEEPAAASEPEDTEAAQAITRTEPLEPVSHSPVDEAEVVTSNLEQLQVDSVVRAEESPAKPKDDLSSGQSVEITVDVADSHHVKDGSDEETGAAALGDLQDAAVKDITGESIDEGSCSDLGEELEDEEDGLVMADELDENFREPLKFRRSKAEAAAAASSCDAVESAALASKAEPTSQSAGSMSEAEADAESAEEAGPSGRDETWVGDGSDDNLSEEDAEVLVRFRVNRHIAVTVHKACTKDDFEEVVSLLPENTPLPSSDRMIYLLARVIEDMETGEVGRAVGCLMASIGTCMISSCIYSFDDPAEVEVYSTEERVELWGLQIPQPSSQLQEMMSAAGEPPLKEWSSVDRLTMSIGLLFGLCCYADDNDIRAGFCVPRPQLLDRWISAGVPMHGLGGQMQLIYPSHAHDYHYYRSSTVAYFLVDEVIETLGFILAFL